MGLKCNEISSLFYTIDISYRIILYDCIYNQYTGYRYYRIEYDNEISLLNYSV